jgi:hypothetical protein
MMRSESSVLVCSPNIIVPRVRVETCKPEWPSVRKLMPKSFCRWEGVNQIPEALNPANRFYPEKNLMALQKGDRWSRLSDLTVGRSVVVQA